MSNVYIELDKMGISHDIVDYADIEITQNGAGLKYPIEYPPVIEGSTVSYPRSWRVKFLKSFLAKNVGHARYFQPPLEELPGNSLPPFYTPNYETLRQAIIDSGGVCEAFEGEPDAWARMTSGYFNCIAFLGTSGVNANTVYHLKALGVKVLKYYPDLDHGGWNAAQNLYDSLERSGIALFIYTLPYMFDGNVIKDARDLWLAVERNIKAFNDVLSSLPEMKILDKKTREDAEDASGAFSEDLYTEIASKLGIQNIKPNHWHDGLKCLFKEHEHDSTNPAGGWHSKKHIFRCFKCGENYLAKDVAEALGIDWHKYINKANANLPSKSSDKKIVDEKEAADKITARELKVANDILIDSFSSYDNVPWQEFLFPLRQGFDNYEKRLLGVQSPMYPPIPFPFSGNAFKALGGFCLVLTPPLMVAIIGASGGYKTATLTTIANRLAMQGYNSIIWSPEWSPDKHTDRVIQQVGGLTMSEMAMLERFYYEENLIKLDKLDTDSAWRFGRYPGEERMDLARQALDNTRMILKGEIVYINQFGASILDVLSMVKSAANHMNEWGKPPHILIMDYVQMALAPQGWNRNWTLNDTVTFIKALTTNLGLVTFNASQSRKSDVEALKDSGQALGATSGMGLRDDQFNLSILLSPTNEMISNRWQILRAEVAKNSIGKTGNLELYVDLRTLSVLDEYPDGA